MKMLHQNAVVASLITILICSTSPLHAAKYKIRWLLGHNNRDYFEVAAKDFKKTVEAASHGDIEVSISATDVQESDLEKPSHEIATKVAQGEAEMGHSFTDVIGSLDHRLWAFEAPYFFRDYKHMEGVFEGAVGSELLEGLRKHHIIGLSFTYSGGASGIATIDREIRSPEDMKNLKVGVYGSGGAVNEAWLRSLGAVPVPIKHGEEGLASSLAQKGSLDAINITWRNFKLASLDRNFKYVNMMNYSYLVSVTYINEKFFESLPKEYQTLLKDASQEAGRIERASTIELNQDSKSIVKTKGVREIYMTEDGRRKFITALQPAYNSAIRKLIGDDLLKKIKNTPDGSIHPLAPSEYAHR